MRGAPSSSETSATADEGARCPHCRKLMFQFRYLDKNGDNQTMSKCYNEACIKFFRKRVAKEARSRMFRNLRNLRGRK